MTKTPRPGRRTPPLVLSVPALLALATGGCGEPESETDADGQAAVAAPAGGDPPSATGSGTASASGVGDGQSGRSDTGDPDGVNGADGPGTTAGADGSNGVTGAVDGNGAGDAESASDTEGASGADIPSDTTSMLRDCESALPCRLDSADGALAVTLSAADGEALDGSGSLRVDFAVEARSRDTAVGLGARTSAIAAGQVLTVDTLRLGDVAAADARDEAAFALLAGVPVNGHATFDGALVGNPPALDRLTLSLDEAGTAREMAFANVPLGAEPSDPVDCEDALPCLWRAADGDATLTLTSVGALRWNRATRLVVSWTLSATRALEVVTHPAGRVSDADGVALELYGVELAGETASDGTPLTHPLDAGETLDGRLVLRRAPADGTTRLARVEPGIGERRALRAPRWRPVFVNLPVER